MTGSVRISQGFCCGRFSLPGDMVVEQFLRRIGHMEQSYPTRFRHDESVRGEGTPAWKGQIQGGASGYVRHRIPKNCQSESQLEECLSPIQLRVDFLQEIDLFFGAKLADSERLSILLLKN